jgi:hypothetical protein
MWTVFLDVLGIIGGVGAVVVGFSAWLGKVWADRILQAEIKRNNVEIETLKTEFQKEIEYSKTQLEILKQSSVRYSEYQFKLYNELWSELYQLEVIAEELWEKADEGTLRRLVEQLRKTKDKIKKNALLVEEEHLSELLSLLDQFGNYQVGKQRLIELRRTRNDYHDIDNINVQSIINGNESFREGYSAILDTLSKKFRHQIKYYQEN